MLLVELFNGSVGAVPSQDPLAYLTSHAHAFCAVPFFAQARTEGSGIARFDLGVISGYLLEFERELPRCFSEPDRGHALFSRLPCGVSA
jgi:hypothetical protein